jgi:hypothetical protein
MQGLRLDGALALSACVVTAMAAACANGGGVGTTFDKGGTVIDDGGAADRGTVGDGSGADVALGDVGSGAETGPAGDDATEAGMVEASTESGPEASADAALEASTEAGADAAPEAQAEAATDGAMEAAPDSGAEAATDGGACVTSTVTNYCSELPALPAPPVIDGVLDCGPTLVAMTPQGWNGTSSLPAGNSASIAVAWRPNGLYVFVEVVTPVVIPADPGSPPYYGSGAEVYADSNVPSSATYDSPGAIQLVAAAPSGSSPAMSGEGYRDAADEGPWSPAEFGTFPTATGFALEAFIEAGNLGLSSWTLASGGQLGFDIAVNVSYASASTMGAQGHREGQYFANVGASPIGPPYSDPRSFCVPTLH